MTIPWNFSLPRSDMVALQKLMTDVYIPQLEAVTPGSGCYLNEVRASSSPHHYLNIAIGKPHADARCQGDPNQPNWQETFYGTNYPRLSAIKAKYDPSDIFYATMAVGSEGWEADVGGRLCRV